MVLVHVWRLGCIYTGDYVYKRGQPTALSVRDPETDRLARELVALTGETMTRAIREALRERLARERKRWQSEIERRRAAINAIVERSAALPLLDDRPEDEILGYDEHGVPS